MADLDAEIDRLYQLPLGEFTPARNALAKSLKDPAIRELEKPQVPAWAVNQLYWRERAVYGRLTRASGLLREEHRKLLGGRPSDIREAERAHREAIREATEAVRQILKEAGLAASPATLQAVHETLEALPHEPPGRLARPLKPQGFEALSGISVKPSLRIVSRGPVERVERTGAASGRRRSSPRAAKPDPADARRAREEAKQREREERERKARQQEAEKALAAAEAAMLRAEEAVKKAEKHLAAARAARDAAVGEYESARRRARENR